MLGLCPFAFASVLVLETLPHFHMMSLHPFCCIRVVRYGACADFGDETGRNFEQCGNSSTTRHPGTMLPGSSRGSLIWGSALLLWPWGGGTLDNTGARSGRLPFKHTLCARECPRFCGSGISILSLTPFILTLNTKSCLGPHPSKHFVRLQCGLSRLSGRWKRAG